MKTIKLYYFFIRKFAKKDIRIILLAGVTLFKMLVQLLCPYILSLFVDNLIQEKSDTLISLASGFLCAVVVNGALSIYAVYLTNLIGRNATNRLRESLVTHILSLDDSFFKNMDYGELIETVEGDVEILCDFFSSMSIVVSSNIFLIVGVIVVSFLNNIVLGVVQLIFALVALLFIWKVHSLGKPVVNIDREKSRKLIGMLGETLNNTETVQLRNMQGDIQGEFENYFAKWLPIRVKSNIAMWLMFMVVLGLQALGYALFLGVGTRLLIEGAITVGTIYLFYSYTNYILDPLLNLQGELQELQRVDASICHVESFFQKKGTIDENDELDFPKDKNGVCILSIENIHFSYTQGVEVLSGVSFNIKQGESVALIAPTGAGKTTLANLILRLYDPTDGRIAINDVDIRDFSLKALRSNIAYIPQNVQIMDATIRDNIAFFDEKISDNIILEAINRMGISEWFDRFESGLDTVLGGQGSIISAGEAQILAIIRAFVKNSKIVILDEITSKIDAETENLILNAQDVLLRGKIGIVIAHNMHTVLRLNRIIALEAGRILESGTPDELMKDKNSYFHKMISRERDS